MPFPRLFSGGASFSGGSVSPLAAALFAKIHPLGVVGLGGTVQVTIQGELSGTVQGDAGLPGVASVGGGMDFDHGGMSGSYFFGAISPLELFTLQGRVRVARQGHSSFTLSGVINPLGMLSDAFSVGTSLEFASDQPLPHIRILGGIGGLNFSYSEGSNPEVNVGISIGW